MLHHWRRGAVGRDEPVKHVFKYDDYPVLHPLHLLVSKAPPVRT